jgi:hypothetical protein
LRLAFDADGFLGFDRLVQSFGPATARHRAAGELIDDQHLAFLHDVVHVLLVEGVGAQELVDDVEPLGLRRVVDLDLPAGLDLLFARHLMIVIDAMYFLRQIRQQEGFVLVGRHVVHPLIGEMDRVALLVEHVRRSSSMSPSCCLLGGNRRSAMWSSSCFCTSCLTPGSCSAFISRLFFGLPSWAL